MSRQKLVDDYFHDVAPYWQDIYHARSVQSAIYEGRRHAVLASIDAMDLAPGSLVLEAGCGAGLTTVALAMRGHSVTATDSVPRMLQMTGELVRESGMVDRVSTELADINRMRFAENRFDVAAAIGVLPWLRSLETPVRELARVVKPGGYLVISVDNVLALNRLLDPRLSPMIEPVKRALRRMLNRLRWGSSPPRACTHSIAQIDRAIAHAGLHKIRGRTIGFGPFTFWGRDLISTELGRRLNNNLQRMADCGVPILRSAGAHYIVVAQKAQRERDNHDR